MEKTINNVDKELVQKARAGLVTAFDELLECYMPTIKSRANRYAGVVGRDVEDFIQEGMLALFRAVKGFDENSGFKFKTYAVTCINNSMASAIKKRMKNLGSELPLAEDESQGSAQTEDLVLEQENEAQLLSHIRLLLSGFELKVLKLYLMGNSYREIAASLNAGHKAVDNALQRIRRKLRPEL